MWDGFGVPHVYGVRESDTYFGLGCAQMRAHGDILLRMYGLARGRGAEYWGDQYLDSDRLVRRMGIPNRGQTWLGDQDPSFLDLLQAFADGVNYYAAHDPAAASDSNRVVLPVTPADMLRHGQRVALSFLAGWPHLTPQQVGSNAWAISHQASATGNALLLSNPHLTWTEANTFFETHLVSEQNEIYGACSVGSPVLSMAFNSSLGWTHTVNTMKAYDEFFLTVADDKYLLDDVWKPFDVEVEKILVRRDGDGFDTELLQIERSIHGPVLERSATRAVAVRAAAVDAAPAPRMYQQWHRMGTARTLEEFEAAVAANQIPMFTIVYADAAGHCMSIFNGRIPVRSGGDFASWARELPGDDATLIWTRTHSYEELPRVLDPPSGWVQNSNSPPWHATLPTQLDPADFPEYLAPPPAVWLREQRSIQMLQSRSKWTISEVVAARHDTHVLLADRVLPDLFDRIAVADQSELLRDAAAVLAQWDRSLSAASKGGLLFVRWIEELLGDDPQTWIPQPLSVPKVLAGVWTPDRPADSPRGLIEGSHVLRALELAATAVLHEHTYLDAPWGTVARLRADAVNLPGSGITGDPWGVFRVISYAEDGAGARRANGGETLTFAVEFDTEPTAYALNVPGNASRPESPHRSDQVALAAEGKMRRVFLTRHDVDAHAELVEELESQSPL